MKLCPLFVCRPHQRVSQPASQLVWGHLTAMLVANYGGRWIEEKGRGALWWVVLGRRTILFWHHSSGFSLVEASCCLLLAQLLAVCQTGGQANGESEE